MDYLVTDASLKTTLRLLATGDLHAETRDFDYARLRSDPGKGLNRAAALIERQRAEADLSLLLDCGDFLYGRPFTGLPDRGAAAVVAAMDALSYDAVTLGNHEFDEGLSSLLQVLSPSKLPMVCANVVWASNGSPVFPPFLMTSFEVADVPLRIGITGVLPPAALSGTNGSPSARIKVLSLESEIGPLVVRLRAEGADIVIALCHDGPHSKGAAVEFAEAGVDALIMGHWHVTFPGPDLSATDDLDPGTGTLRGVPAVMPGAWARAVGQIDLRLERSETRWRVVSSDSRVLPVPASSIRSAATERVEKATFEAHVAALGAAQHPVLTLSENIHTYFTQLGRCRATRLSAAAAAEAVRSSVAGTALAELPIIGLAAPAKAGGFGGPRDYVDVPRGVVTKGDLMRLSPHRDLIGGMAARGRDVTAWLERSVSALHQVAPGTVCTGLVDPSFPPSDFDLPSGVTFELDLSRPAAFDARGHPTGAPMGRVRNLRYAGQPLAADASVLLAMTEHRQRGGGGFPVPADAVRIFTGIDVPRRGRTIYRYGPRCSGCRRLPPSSHRSCAGHLRDRSRWRKACGGRSRVGFEADRADACRVRLLPLRLRRRGLKAVGAFSR